MAPALLLLLGSVTSILLEAYKWLVKKYGQEATKHSLYLGAFALALVWQLLLKENIVTWEAVKEISATILAAVGFYEVIVKTVKQLFQISQTGTESDQQG